MKLKPWQIGAIALLVGAGLWLYKKHNEKVKEEAEAKAGQEGVTGVYGEGEGEQFPYSVVGAGGPGGIGGQEAAAGIREFEQEFKQSQREEQTKVKEREIQQAEQFANLSRSLSERLAAAASAGPSAAPVTINLGSGGGAPQNPTGGVTVAPTQARCPDEFPLYNGADGPVGSHSCYKYSRDRCPPPRIYKHVYADSHIVCASS